MDNTQRQLRVEEELQKMRVHLFHTRHFGEISQGLNCFFVVDLF